MMPQDIYSKAGADAAFVADSPEGRQALAESPEVKATNHQIGAMFAIG